MMNNRVLIAVCFLLGGTAVADAMSVEEAYRAIPHGRTVFFPQDAKMSPAEIDYLQKLFDWIDQGIVAKVTAMRNTPADKAYANVWSIQKTLNPPSKLKHEHTLVEESIK